jgi:hypothetical protein
MLLKHRIRVAIGGKRRPGSFEEFNATGSFTMLVDDAELAAIKRLQKQFEIHAKPGSGVLQFTEIEQVEA